MDGMLATGAGIGETTTDDGLGGFETTGVGAGAGAG